MRAARRPDAWRSYLPGFLILVILVSVSTVVFFLDTIRRALEEGPDIVVVAAEARGLAPGADVWVAGTPSGRVTRVMFDDPHGPAESRVVIHATLHWAAVRYLREDAKANIAGSSLLAPVVLKIDPGHPDGGPFDFADTLTVPAVKTTAQLLALADEARGAMDTLAVLSEELTASFAEGHGTAPLLMRDARLLSRMMDIAADAQTVATALASEDALPARFAADSLGAAMAAMADAVRSLRGEERAEAVTGALADLARRLERIAESLDRLDRDLRAGRGTAGRALYDDEIARQREAFGARLDSLKLELRREPGRWLRFKLF